MKDYFQRFDDQITIFTALCVFFVPSLLRFKTTVQKEIENELGAIKRKTRRSILGSVLSDEVGTERPETDLPLT